MRALIVQSALMLLCLTAGVSQAQLPPEKSLATLRPATGIDVQLFAAEPLVTNPAAIDIDSHGRVWVAEIQWYRRAAKNPPADKIKVLQDTDGDGRADKATVFADGIHAPMSICVAGDRVYAFVRGELLMWTDRDGDLRADGPPEKILTGFSNKDHDHTAHSIVIGPDHKWYMAHGDTGFDVTGRDGSKVQYKWGAMIRGELDGTKLEAIAVNFRNPYEITVNSFGQAFCSDNDNDGNQSTRVCWIMEGGDYGWFGGPPFAKNELDQRVPPGTPYREHWHFRGYQPGYIPATVMTGFGSPCGMCFYEGDLFGKALKNMPLHCDPGPREVRAYPHELRGFGMIGRQENLLITKEDKYFRPDDVCVAPDGSIYFADWYDGGVGGHAYNDPDRGRIYRLVPGDKKQLVSPTQPGPYQTIPAAIAALRSVNLDMQFQARERLLTAGSESIPALKQLLNDPDHNLRARAYWLLDRIGGAGTAEVLSLMSNEDAKFRALGVRILARHGDRFAAELLPLTADADGQVAGEAIRALRFIDPKHKLYPDVFTALVAAANRFQGADRYELESLHIAVGKQGSQIIAALIERGTFRPAHFPLLQLWDPQSAGVQLTKLLKQASNDPTTGLSLLESIGRQPGAEAGNTLAALMTDSQTPTLLRARAMEIIALNINTIWQQLRDNAHIKQTALSFLADGSPELRAAAIKLVQAAVWREASIPLLQLAADERAAIELRGSAIDAALSLRNADLIPTLRKQLAASQGAWRLRILTTLAELQDQKTIRDALLAADLPAADAAVIIKTSLRSAGGALGLLKLLEEKKLSPDTAQQILHQATKHPDSNVRLLYEGFLPADQRPKKLGDAVKAEEILRLTGKIQRGRQIFMEANSSQCKSCHMIDGIGSTLGPDLSLIGKKYERGALLDTILYPSKAISHGYEAYLVETTQGQTYLGFLVEQTDKMVTLKDAEGRLIRLAAEEIDTLEKQERSLMPELVLKDVTPQDAADLLDFLASLTKGTTAAGALQILGPFNGKQFGLDQAHPVEAQAAGPDLTKTFAGPKNSKIKWEVAESDGKLGFAGIDTVAYDKARKLNPDNTTHYALCYVDSLTDQEVELLIGSDDGCKVWFNGREIHKNNATRPLTFGADRLPVKLQRGRNVVLIKVVSGNPPGGVSLGVRSSDPVTLKTE